VDGASGTILLAEVRTREEPYDERGAWALGWNAATLLAFDMHDLATDLFGPINTAYNAHPDTLAKTQPPNNTGWNIDILRRCPEPGEAQLTGMPCGANLNYISAAPRSHHIGGVNIGLLDGSVRFLANDVDDYVMAYSVSINDGEAHAVSQ
jgi:prepilin-type processing-associated H-X9-DG protein